MVFNLGDGIEIACLRNDLGQIQKQIDRFVTFIPAENGLEEFQSWKYPTISALDVDTAGIILKCDAREKNLDEAKSIHVTLLELFIDRLLVFVQFSGVVYQRVTTPHLSDFGKRTNIGLIAKYYCTLLENAAAEWTSRQRAIRANSADAEQEVDVPEIVARNPCVDCPLHAKLLLELLGKLAGVFQTPLIKDDALPEDSRNFAQNVTHLLETHAENSRSLHRLTKITTETASANAQLEASLSQVQDSNSTMRSENQLLETKVTADKGQQEEQSRQLKTMLVKLEELQRSQVSKSWERDDLIISRAESRKRVENLKASLRKTDLQLDMLDAEFERTTTTVAKKNDVLRKQIENTKEDLRKYEGFDRNWMLRYSILQQEQQKLHQDWQISQNNVVSLGQDFTARNLQLSVLRDEHHRTQTALVTKQAQLTCIINEKKRQKLAAEAIPELPSQIMPEIPVHSSELILPNDNLPQITTVKQSHQLSVKTESGAPAAVESLAEPDIKPSQPVFRSDKAAASGDAAFPQNILSPVQVAPVLQTTHSLSKQSDTLRSLFADFLEIPDFQSMPEWDLVPDYDTPASPVDGEDMDITDDYEAILQKFEKTSISEIGPSVVFEKTIVSETCPPVVPKVVSPAKSVSSCLTVQSLGGQKLSVSSTHLHDEKRVSFGSSVRSSLSVKTNVKQPIMEASWIIKNPNAKLNQKKRSRAAKSTSRKLSCN